MAINGTRWKIGWSPKLVIISLLVVGFIVGAMAGGEEPAKVAGQLGIVGLIGGTAVWLWGRHEVNAKYTTLLEDFRDSSRKQVERETGGMTVSSAHTFISAVGSSPMGIEPARKYSTAHLLFGDTSVVVNRQYKYDMKERTQRKGGKQQEVFYDQISNVQSEDYNNYAELEISLSSGDTERIRGRDTAGINRVKSDLQQKMREARRGRRQPQSGAPSRGQQGAGGQQTAAGQQAGGSQRNAGGQRNAAGQQTGERQRNAGRQGNSGGQGRGRDQSDSAGSGASGSSGASDSVSTDWLAGDSANATLVVRNDASASKSVRVGCRVDGEKRLADDVRLDPGDTADWDDLPDSQFEVGVVVDGGPSAGQRFDPQRDSVDEISVSVTDSEVVFGDRGESGGGSGSSARSAGSSGSPSGTTTAGANAGGAGGAGTAGDADAGASDPSSASGSDADEGSGAVSAASSAASKVFGGSGDGGSGGGGQDAVGGKESFDSAAELADAVQQSATPERVERLTSFLDASSPSERRSAIRGLRQSVRDQPDTVAGSVRSVAGLLESDDGEVRQEATVTLQRLAESRPDAVADVTDGVVDRLDDDNPKVRTAACRTLDAVGANAGAEKLEELADEDQHKGVQVAAYNALQSVRN
ncbi:HEAT repeat domain-containing protein [Halorussus litoreus]|uniref:HEAT repeat domain-containing protein n=1 Tax=Halorussus litoreus TaxID=1710536 RepID=UPI000E26846B|nr:HEAT repeat domain-containing protein [Halorussus litoreus]